MTGAGELNMVVTDPFGQQRVISQPFYVAQQLLSPGLTEFSIGAGAGRLDYGIENFNYGRNLAYAWAASWNQRKPAGELRGEVNDEGAAIGAGADILVGNLGVLSLGAAATAGQLGNGTRYLVGFDRQTQFLSVGGRVSRATNNYREIGDLGHTLLKGPTHIFDIPLDATDRHPSCTPASGTTTQNHSPFTRRHTRSTSGPGRT